MRGVERDRDELDLRRPRARPSFRASRHRAIAADVSGQVPLQVVKTKLDEHAPCLASSPGRTACPRRRSASPPARGRCRPGGRREDFTARGRRGRGGEDEIERLPFSHGFFSASCASSAVKLSFNSTACHARGRARREPRSGPPRTTSSTFSPSGVMRIRRTQNVSSRSRVESSEFDDVHPLAVARDVHHVRLRADLGRAEQLRVVGVGHVELLDRVAAEVADEQVLVVGALPQVGRQWGRCRRPS